MTERTPDKNKNAQQYKTYGENFKGVHGSLPDDRIILTGIALGARFQTQSSYFRPHSTNAASLLLRGRRPCQARGPGRLPQSGAWPGVRNLLRRQPAERDTSHRPLRVLAAWVGETTRQTISPWCLPVGPAADGRKALLAAKR